jgi:hypothetical protein
MKLTAIKLLHIVLTMVNPTLSFHHVSRFIVRQRSQLLTTKMGKSESSQDEDRHSSRQSRRENLRELSRLVLATGLGISIFGFEKQSLAYEQNYPQELEMYATDSSKDLQSIKKARIEAKRLEYQKDMDSNIRLEPSRISGSERFLHFRCMGRGALASFRIALQSFGDTFGKHNLRRQG